MDSSEGTNRLGAYLRARRALVTPEQAGIVAGLHRRVLGLRREEVAMLAGISADYYLRLERGRDKNPSEQVLVALGRVLRLDEVEHRYLLDLAKPLRRARPSRRVERVPARLHHLLAAAGCRRSSRVGISTCWRRTHSPWRFPRGCDQVRTVCGL